MLTIVLLASLAQVPTADDFYFMMAQENLVMDMAVAKDEHAGYEAFMPVEIARRVLLFRDDCWRCRQRARDEVVAMGPDALRWMFWSLRSIDWDVSTTSAQAIGLMIRCRRCDGKGRCYEFRRSPDPNDKSDACHVCGLQEDYHNYGYDYSLCRQCSGRGIFPRSFDEDAMRAEYGRKAMDWIRGKE